MDDFWAWNNEKNGNFTVRSAYRMLVDTKQRREDWLEGNPGISNGEVEAKAWCSLWSVDIPGKIHNFLWRLAKQSIPTEDVHHQRKMADANKCHACRAQDSWRHTLLECSMARCVWALADVELLDHIQSVQLPNAKQWIFEMIENLPHARLTELVVTLWAIWFSKSKLIHEGTLQSPHATHAFIVSYLAELATIKAPTLRTEHSTAAARTGQRRGWKAPSPGTAKIHVDGGLSRNGLRGACSAICRDHTRTYLGSSAMVFPHIMDPVTLEALAWR